ncbi:Zinc transporter ZupT [Syntrophomonas zehnderi OL-4]|uniref:Zinc transporter ZupT n=1 Tax=Syntrophomonas zehnderi OL-4 TaxID=690567 RepID=A0A0E3W2T3_9FIRM|nr:Zinc transporter ZupT [Syntrophomonas zehnderi OL-4]
MSIDNVTLAFILTALAGLSTGIGSLIAFFAKRTNTTFLSVALGFSAGVMIYVAMVELLAEAQEIGVNIWGKQGLWAVTGAFFAGMILIALIDKLVPEYENPHEPKLIEGTHDPVAQVNPDALMRLGIMTAMAIAIHNFPEGMATFVSVLHDPSVGIVIALAIAIHNIPEGIAISVPVYYATGDKRKAFLYSFLSGLSEPLGALIAYLILLPFLSEALLALLFAAIAGIMVFISLDGLLPAAREYGENHHAIYGMIAGMMVMALSLLLM